MWISFTRWTIRPFRRKRVRGLSQFVRLLIGVAVGAMLAGAEPQPLVVSANRRYLQTVSGEPFFWLGDTAWLMAKKLDRAEAERYLEDRRRKGFNVIQVMVLHTAKDHNAYGAAALADGDPARPRVTPGARPTDPEEYDFWDHLDWMVSAAANKGMYLALVPAWGSIARSGILNESNVETYGRFLAERYGRRPNVIWLNGGDTHGNRETEVWRRLGRTLKQLAPQQLVTFHPFGRTQSSTWFHEDDWLDFNMFQSGHRRYDQDSEAGAKGEDNWRYVEEDLARKPPKPTIDGEPSYEGIPQGLHDPAQPYWTHDDARRYAWWSVLAGAFGHTYGHSAVMQMHKPGQGSGAYGVRKYWYQGLDDPGAGQMQWLRKLMLSRPYFERRPDQTLIAGENGVRYDYVIASRGESYAFVYTYTGRPFEIRMGRIRGEAVRAWWYDPRSGDAAVIGTFANSGIQRFIPPGTPAPGNDWVLVLDDAAQNFTIPGTGFLP